MEIEPRDFANYVEGLASVEGATDLCQRLGVARSTLYRLMKGDWPTREVLEKFDVRLSVPGGNSKKRGKGNV